MLCLEQYGAFVDFGPPSYGEEVEAATAEDAKRAIVARKAVAAQQKKARAKLTKAGARSAPKQDSASGTQQNSGTDVDTAPMPPSRDNDLVMSDAGLWPEDEFEQSVRSELEAWHAQNPPGVW